MTRRPPPEAAYNVDLTEVQSLALSGYRELPEACYLLLRLDYAEDRLGAWLAETAKQVRFGRAEGERYTSVNVAFSHPGFAACGLESRALAEFGPAFREGMSGSGYRSRDLGDVGECAPEHWRWGNVHRPKSLGSEFSKEDPKHVDAVLMLFGANDAALDKLLADAQECAAACNIREVERPLRAAWPRAPQFEGLREHFGFADGISQPQFRLQVDDDTSDLVAPGELLLGYPNEAGEIVRGPTVRATRTAHAAGLRLAPDGGRCDFGRGGTYLVLREIDQNVIAFWQFAHDSASGVLSMERCAAKVVGRWRNGAPLTLVREEPRSFCEIDKSNEFAFCDAEDAEGFGCPIGAHIRRANPRDTKPRLAVRQSLAAVRRHRILRRGRPYGKPVPGWPDPKAMLDKASATPDPEGTRGLYFICLNADIEQQFEVVQQRWLNDPTFVNGRWDEVDPLLGRTRTGGQFIVPTTSGPLTLDVPLRRFVTVRGGEYFFLPSKSALSYLATIRHEG